MDKYLTLDHPTYSRFPDETKLNKYDKSISLFLTKLPFNFEPFLFIIFFFGHVFGTPLTSLSAVPTVFLFHAHANPSPFTSMYGLIIAVILITVFFCVYTKIIIKDDDKFFDGNAGLIALFTIANLCIFKFIIGDIVAYNMLCTYYFSWIILNISAWLLKVYFLRDRPALYYGKQFLKENIPRYVQNTMWKKMLLKSSQGKNARHSFPSLDSAVGGCVVGILVELNKVSTIINVKDVTTSYQYKDIIFSICIFSFIMGMFGRVYLFAHHFVDVIVGGSLGFLFPLSIRLYFADNVSTTTTFYVFGGICLTWLIVYIVSLATFFFVPKSGLFLAIGYICVARWYFTEFSIVTLFTFATLLFTLSTIFHVQAKKVKPWVVQTMNEYFNEIEDPIQNWPISLQKLLIEKRVEFLKDCSEIKEDGSDNIFPGDVYLSGKFIKTKHFACDWNVLKTLMLKRLDHFVENTGIDINDIDLILGIYSGGALLAPIISEELNLPLEFIKAKRYKGLNLNLTEFAYVALQRALGKHDDAYKLSKLPDKRKLKGKNILMIDDACVSGGTFKAVAKFCKEEAGCKEIRGLALAGSPSTSSHIWDPTMKKKPTIQKIDMPIFSPWGTF